MNAWQIPARSAQEKNMFGWALLLALVGQGACFQLAGSPFGRIDKIRWRTAHSRGVRLLHEAASVVRPDSSESGGSGQERSGEGSREDERGSSPMLVDFFVRWVDLVSIF